MSLHVSYFGISCSEVKLSSETQVYMAIQNKGFLALQVEPR